MTFFWLLTFIIFQFVMGNLLSSLVFRPPTPPSYNINEIDRSPTTINPPSSTHSNVGICADSTSCFSQPNPSTPAFKSRIHRSLLPREDDDDEFPHVQQDTWHIKSFALKASARPSKFVKKYGDKITIVELPAGGTVCSIYFEHPKSRGITLIYSHGNAGEGRSETTTTTSVSSRLLRRTMTRDGQEGSTSGRLLVICGVVGMLCCCRLAPVVFHG